MESLPWSTRIDAGWPTENLDLFIAHFASRALHHNWSFPAQRGPENGQQATTFLLRCGVVARRIAGVRLTRSILAEMLEQGLPAGVDGSAAAGRAA